MPTTNLTTAATTRLRRTFAYPTDSASTSPTPEALDEDEQDSLIQTLATQNARTNTHYQRLLLALPALAAVPYLCALFFQPRPPGAAASSAYLVSLLALTSLASTAFLLLSLPITETGIPLLDAWAASGSASHDDEDEEDEDERRGSGSSGLGALMKNQRRRRRQSMNSSGTSLMYQVPKSPLERYLPFLNLGLCAILVLSGIALGRTEGNAQGGREGQGQSGGFAFGGLLGLGNLPGIVYGVVIVAKLVMASVDPERELTALKYGYKGA